MWRNTMLAKLVDPEVTLDDEELQEAFNAKYGRKAQVRHIQTASLTEAQEILKTLADGADFAELAKEKSVNPITAKNGGLLEPIGSGDKSVQPALKQAVLSLEEPGDLSEPIQVATAFHILRLERIIEPQDVKFEDVKNDLADELRMQKSQTLQNQLFGKLIREANIEYGCRPVPD